MKEILLKPEAVNEENFAPFGRLVFLPRSNADYQSEQFDWYDEITLCNLDTASFGLVHSYPQQVYTEYELECHNHTEELLLPLDADIALILRKPGAFDVSDVSAFHAFLVPKHTLICLKESVWHHAPISIHEECNTLVVYKYKTGKIDKQVVKAEEAGVRLILKQSLSFNCTIQQ